MEVEETFPRKVYKIYSQREVEETYNSSNNKLSQITNSLQRNSKVYLQN